MTRFGFRLDSSSGTHYSGATHPPEDGFSLTVLWNFVEAEQARMSLRSHSHDDVRLRRLGRQHVTENMHTGDVVSFRMIASSVSDDF